MSDYNIEGTPFSVSFSDYFDSQKAEFKIIQEKEAYPKGNECNKRVNVLMNNILTRLFVFIL